MLHLGAEMVVAFGGQKGQSLRVTAGLLAGCSRGFDGILDVLRPDTPIEFGCNNKHGLRRVAGPQAVQVIGDLRLASDIRLEFR